MFGERAFKLVRDYHRSQEVMPQFDDLAVQAILDEMTAIDKFIHEGMDTTHNNSTMAEEIDNSALHAVQSATMVRNKRCLLAYVWNRMQRLRQLRWEFGSMLPADVKANLNESEMEWIANYGKTLNNYMRTLNQRHGLNLAQNMKPPKSLFMEVRSLVDEGKLETDDGEVVTLKKNSRLLLPWSQAEPLIRQGILEHSAPPHR
ncbi:DNA replication complex GINS protein PSF1 [Nilaparvata lugens]|uniref:DNA replication complex GINS protein PSF1 n=1 Tax=Nilaparvata lugens TaxID=108931 RepID=UPI00193E262E|nr:DNA replication complex GINS protein PSF1 [Nilaparvata lugens]